MTDTGGPVELPTAGVHRRRRIPLVWIVPIVTALIALWLAWDTLSKRGPTITIAFDSAAGLTAGQSQLKYKNVVMGTVKSIGVSPDFTKVIVSIETVREAEPLLNDKTIFWVVKPELFAGNITGLETLLSGSYIGMRPSAEPGVAKRDFIGKTDPPVLQAWTKGTTFMLDSKRLGSISLGSPIFFRDLEVGTVLGWDIGDLASRVTIHAFVRAPYDQYVHADSSFWNASGVSIKMGADGVQFRMESLRAVLLGGIAFETPPDSKQPVAANNQLFPLYRNFEDARSAGFGRQIRLLSYFPGSVAGLEPGAHVTLHGLRIGEVTDVDLVYDPKLDRVVVPVHYRIEAGRVSNIAEAERTDPEKLAEDMIKARRARHAAVDEHHHRLEGDSAGADCRCAARHAGEEGRRLRHPDLGGRRLRRHHAVGRRAPDQAQPHRVRQDRQEPRKRRGWPRYHDQRRADEAHAGVAGEGDGRRPGHRQEARHRSHAGTEAPAGDRPAAAGRADLGQSPVRLVQYGLRRQFALPPRPRPPAAAAHRRRALAPRLDRSSVTPSRGPDQGPHQHGQGMKDLSLGRRRFALGLPLVAAACGASPEPNYYTIVSRTGPTLPRGPKVVLLKDIGLASYLDRREIVRSSESYKLDIRANDWWGEPLAGLLGRVLVVELSQRLPSSTVYAESGAISADHNCIVGVNIQRLDADKAGSLILVAQVAAEFNRPRRTAARTFTITKPLATQDTPGLVAAISDAVGELADGIATLLQ